MCTIKYKVMVLLRELRPDQRLRAIMQSYGIYNKETLAPIVKMNAIRVLLTLVGTV